jgi:hypothetical protein
MASTTSPPPAAELLPTYSVAVARVTPPAAVRPRPLPVVERKFPLAQIRQEPWAHLKIKSRGGSPRDRPQFFQGEEVQGSVELDVQKGDTAIRSVEISVSLDGPGPRFR